MHEIDPSVMLAFVWFAWIGSITPGPNCALALSTAVNFGARSTAPHMLGVAIGFSGMLLASALGAAQLIDQYPVVGATLKWFGITYLAWQGVQIARSSSMGERAVARPPRVHESALLQLANPKAWMLMVATAGAFQGIARPAWLQHTIIVVVFAVCCTLALMIWAWVGQSMRGWLAIGNRLRAFNIAIGASLLATAVWMALR